VRALDGEVAVVTGGGSGIGRELAIQLARSGARVAVCDVNESSASQTVDIIGRQHGGASFHCVDVADEREMQELARSVLDLYGVVDIVANVAGIFPGAVPAADLELETFRRVIDVNTWGVIHGSLAFLPHLVQRPRANLVNVASWAGIAGFRGLAAYCTSKFAVRGFTEALQTEHVHSSLTVTLVCPGATRTRILANSPFVEPERRNAMQEAMDAAKFLKSPERVAATIVRGIRRDKTRVLIGLDTRGMDKLARAFPGSYSRVLGRDGVVRAVERVLG